MRLICPGCTKQLDCGDDAAGSVRQCPLCHAPFRVPQPKSATASPAPSTDVLAALGAGPALRTHLPNPPAVEEPEETYALQDEPRSPVEEDLQALARRERKIS